MGLWHDIGREIRIILRFLRLQIIHQTATRSTSHENPKVVLYRKPSITGLSALLHLVPLSAALILIVLNACGDFVRGVSPTFLTALQFAAKLHEILMQASLATILLSYIHHCILGSGNLPLGALTAPYRFTDISYLWSLELWGSLTSKNIGRWQRAILATLIPLTISLGTLVGPSSAVLMIPRVSSHLAGQYLVFWDKREMVFPMNLALGKNYSIDMEIFHQGVQEILNQDDIQTYVLTDTQYALEYTLSRHVLSQDDSQIIGNSSFYTGFHNATLPSRAASGVLQLSLEEAKLLNLEYVTMQTLQPLVNSTCYSDQNPITQGQADQFIHFGPHEDLNNLIMFADLPVDMTNYSYQHFYYWIEAPASVTNPHSLLLAQGSWNGSTVSVDTCIYDAVWVDTVLNQTSASGINAIEFSLHNLDSPRTPKAVIHIDTQIGQLAIDTLLNVTLGTGSPGSFQLDDFSPLLACALSDLALSYLQTEQYGGVPTLLQGEKYAAASLYTYGLTKNQSYNMMKLINETNLFDQYEDIILFSTDWTDPSELTRQTLNAYGPAYGYSTSEVTVKFSLVVIGMYCAIALTFLIYSVWTGRTSHSWDSTTELLLLGMNSHYPEHLGNTSAGVEALSTLQEPVNVKFNPIKKALELVFTRDPHAKTVPYEDVEVNKAY